MLTLHSWVLSIDEKYFYILEDMHEFKCLNRNHSILKHNVTNNKYIPQNISGGVSNINLYRLKICLFHLINTIEIYLKLVSVIETPWTIFSRSFKSTVSHSFVTVINRSMCTFVASFYRFPPSCYWAGCIAYFKYITVICSLPFFFKKWRLFSKNAHNN